MLSSANLTRSGIYADLIGAVGLTILAGCVGPGDLLHNEPSLKANTKKSPREYALCVFPEWQDARTDSSMNETESGYRLLVASNNMADELLEVRKSAEGSDVTLYQRMAWSKMPGRTAAGAAAKTCL
jgi:hypothetical protein